MKFGRKKLETSLHRVVQNAFRYLELFRRGTRTRLWRTDRRRDRRTDRNGYSNSVVWRLALKTFYVIVFAFLKINFRNVSA